VSYATVSATPLSAKSEREKSVAVTARSITIITTQKTDKKTSQMSKLFRERSLSRGKLNNYNAILVIIGRDAREAHK